MSNTADVLIIGGGIHGASLAFHLAERGVKPLVLEKNFIGAGATGRSSGMIRMHYDVRQDSELAWVSFGYFRNWAERLGTSTALSTGCGFTRTGFIQIAAREHEAALRKNTAMHQDIGIASFLISADDVKRLAPTFLTDDFDIAAYEPKSGYADPSSTAASLVNAAKEKGTRIVQDCTVTGVIVESGEVKGVNTTQGDFFAPVVVNAAGPWADKLKLFRARYSLHYLATRYYVRGRAQGNGTQLSRCNRLPERNVLPPRNRRPDAGWPGRRQSAGESPEDDTDHATKALSSAPSTVSASACRLWKTATCTLPTAATMASRPTNIPCSGRPGRKAFIFSVA